jgi:hypothetical protein
VLGLVVLVLLECQGFGDPDRKSNKGMLGHGHDSKQISIT